MTFLLPRQNKVQTRNTYAIVALKRPILKAQKGVKPNKPRENFKSEMYYLGTT